MKDILDTLAADGSFQTLLSLLDKAGLTATLRGQGPFTLFAPNDAAFTRVRVAELAGDRENLVSILSYHIVSGRCTAAEIARDDHLDTSSGKALTVRTEEGVRMIDNARYVRTDVECANGIVHVIDNVFLPQMSGWYCGCC
jgi:uncharacterized surface protein with fasciclin (FAS1) repeats